MALLMVQEGVQPAGQFDLKDGYTPKGGEVYVLESTKVDGYQVVKARGAQASDAFGPFYLADDGLKGYGVYFGNTVTRTATGFAGGVDTAIRLGPATYTASGKVTLWDKPGLYAVSLDALDNTESELQDAVSGTKLTVTAGGVLTLDGANQAGAAVATVVAYKVDEALVTTGGSALNKQKLVISFNPHGEVV